MIGTGPITTNTIIQNAVYIPSEDRFVVSTHQHDYQDFKLGKSEFGYIDGGTAYLRKGGTNNWKDFIIDYSLILERDSFVDVIVQKLLWGTRGKDGRQPLTYRRIYSLETSHLEAILANCPNASQIVKQVILYCLNKRNSTSERVVA